jgi:hypothetical protein
MATSNETELVPFTEHHVQTKRSKGGKTYLFSDQDVPGILRT